VSSPREVNLAPAAGRVLRGRVVRLVALSSLVAAAVPCVLWAFTTHEHLRSHVDRAGPLALEWSAERLQDELETARTEIQRLAERGALPRATREAEVADLRSGPLATALRTALGGSQRFAALVVVDRLGNPLAAAGASPGLDGLLEKLEPRSALESELVDVMEGVRLRKELAGVESPTLRVLDVPGEGALPLACAPLSGEAGASLHGLLRREALAGALRSGPLAGRGSVTLLDAGGRVVAASGAEAPAAAGGDLWPELARAVARGWSLRYEQPVPALGWTLVAEAPVLEGFRSLAASLCALLVLPPLFAVLFGGLAFGAGARLARPLWTLYAGMRRAALEDEPVEVDVRRAEGEAESLVLAFNATIRRLQRKSAEAEQSNRALREQNQAFQAQHETLAKLTVTDALTKLPNRRKFEEQLALEIKRLSRAGEKLSMLVLDIDDFKRLNDHYGHAAGDEFLRQVASILQENVRATDLVARYGGEEFVVVATGTDLSGARVLAEKLRTAVAEASFIVDESKRPRRATVSVGVAQYRGSQTDLFNSADSALYEAKAAGKNCVMVARGPRGDFVDSAADLEVPDST
jgi:diguanylate cyclase (GGDEF)-like protein